MTLSQVISKVVYYLALILLFKVVIDVLGIESLDEAVGAILSFAVSTLLPAILILVITIIIANFVKNLVSSTAKQSKMKNGELLANISFVAILVFGAVPALQSLGVDTSIFKDNITILVAGVALAFGLGGKDLAKKILEDSYKNFSK